MSSMTLADRVRLAEGLRRSKRDVAVRVTDEFLARHPDWVERYGERARSFGIEDAGFHVDFLSSAIEGGEPAAFEDYVRWTRRVLEARGIVAAFLAENLEQVGAALGEGRSPEDREVIDRFVSAGSGACAGSPSAAIEHRSGPLDDAEKLFLRAILAGQRRAATAVATEALDSGWSTVDLYVDVFAESLYEVGRLWEASKIAVAEEHMATAIAQYVLAQVAGRIDPAPPRGKAVVAGVRGELHQIGGHMAADVLESLGWEVRFLGSNMPHEGILDAIAEHGATLVGISATMPFNVGSAVELVRAVRERYSTSGPRIVLGGAAFRSSPRLAIEAGANAYAPDLRGLESLV